MEFYCSICHIAFTLSANQKPGYCPFCKSSLDFYKGETMPLPSTEGVEETSLAIGKSASLIPEHYPISESIQFSIGPYQVFRSIGKGGMGEVFLAYDTTCGRKIALKRIRSDLNEHIQMHNRFMKEARITSQLTHPAIIPIYAIHGEDHLTYYTMPFVEGDTLKEIIRTSRKQEKNGEKILHHIGSSIPALVRIFITVCQAVAYAHSKKVLHRDLKPENIIVGKYGEVLILDWGLAKILTEEDSSPEPLEEKQDLPSPTSLHQLTNLGRVVGTISYMAPERATGLPATYQTDIYSLGVILYQILTLRPPFQRKSLKEFRENMADEVLQDPVELAPYRDIPPVLSRITLKCLNTNLDHRYKTVDELIHDLENYIEGRSEWFPIAELNIQTKNDWEFQENILIAEHTAITRGTESSDWVSLMISKASFTENTRLEVRVKIGEKGHGIGFLLSIPEAAERVHLNDGYCLWIGSDLNKSTKLLRSTVEVMHVPEIFLKRHEWYQVRIEKIDHNIHFYLNEALQFSYISHLPVTGTHIGLLSRDADFAITPLTISVGNQNIQVNCLAVPDAFLAHKDYTTALAEYRRIGNSFHGRAEGREAKFRAGITLMEQAKDCSDPQRKNELFELSLEEFGKLHSTPGAPLEYLGKALVYQTLHEYEEEIKCFELAYRRYPHHPLLHILQEQAIYRMQESSRTNRKATYNFILFTVRYLPVMLANSNIQKLFKSLQKHWEPLYFIEEDPQINFSQEIHDKHFAIQLAFWLAKPYILLELIDEMMIQPQIHLILIGNALFSLLELGALELGKNKLKEIQTKLPVEMQLAFRQTAEVLQVGFSVEENSLDNSLKKFFEKASNPLNKNDERTLIFLLEFALDRNQSSLVYDAVERAKLYEPTSHMDLKLNAFKIWACLIDKNWTQAGELLHQYPIEFLAQESTLLHLLYGCWLTATESKEIAAAHFSGLLEVSFPRSWTLLEHALNGKIVEGQGWFQKAFMWEKRQLYRQYTLYSHCMGNENGVKYYRNLEQQEYV